ncbi:hypothetical protein FE257_002508 [Aspergillus nanangensis]|uniref:Xylanolytic transcriptional activator regulatory domain-containing protein n=1 Tax=Aspergillus nanangensis TaxID=2582783 RepID=A0AAD4CTA7_ASPNN|nr:hypothetical protein FE257_002508 [Aspergillus nanangensis]
MEQSYPQKARPAQACETCHEKKLTLSLRPHQRKRKRPARASSPSADGYLAEKRHSHPPPPPPGNRRLSVPGERHIPPGLGFFDADHNGGIVAIEPIAEQRQVVATTTTTPPTTSEEAEETAENTPGSRGYLGRSEYLGEVVSHTNEGTTDAQPEKTCLLSHEEQLTLEVYRVFDLPPLPVQRSLLDSFRKHCAPWMPIVEDSWLQTLDGNKPSFLLLQSVFLAGSRVAAAPYISSSSERYYRRAKALFFSSYEKNPIIKIAAACLLNWWNPRGPEEVSLDGSGFWLRVAVAIAYQIGLHREPSGGKTASYRRRLWWTLVARDCQLSAAHGRPSAITLADADVSPASILDFGREDPQADLFVAFVKINTIMADVTKTYLRHQLSPTKRQQIRNALYCWMSELPQPLRLFTRGQLSPYDLCTRSLHIAYFVTLTILYRSAAPSNVSTSIAVVAASFLCGIYEEFLTRDEWRFQGPIFKFHVFAAGMALLNARAHMQKSALEPSLAIVRGSLIALSERWPSANRNIEVIDRIIQSMPAQASRSALPPIPDTHEAKALFDTFGPDLCNMWSLLDSAAGGLNNAEQAVDTRGVDTAGGEAATGSLALMDSLPSVQFLDHIGSDTFLDPSTLWTWPEFQAGNWLVDHEQHGVFGSYPS